jgi:proline iminopeptidase
VDPTTHGRRTWTVRSPGARMALAALVALAAGLGTDLFAARGPTTAVEALAAMAVVFVAGLAGGALTGSKWSFLVQLPAYMLGVEAGRMALEAPSLDVRFDNVYGIIAFVITRGVHLLLVLPPLAAGIAVALAAMRSAQATPPRRRRLPLGTAVLVVVTAALVALVAWPAGTPPVRAADGSLAPRGIAELATVRLGGVDQTVLIRAADPDKPVLLYLSGGPGQSDLAMARVLSEPWTSDFVVADLDQRGNGKSYPAIDPLSDMTLDRAVSDVIDLTDYLRGRFGERRIYLMGESWGTILGVLAVQRRPDLFHAWIGSGQMVDIVETDRRIYDDLRAYATRTGDTALAAKLAEIGSPPYRDIPWANSNMLAWYDYLYKPYEPSAGFRARGDASGLDPFGMLGSEYSFIEKTNVLRGLVDTFAAMYPQLYALDFRRSVRSLDVPAYILDGTAELAGRRDVMLEWYATLSAPIKQRIEYAGAAHSVAFEQADAVRSLLVDTIVPATYQR